MDTAWLALWAILPVFIPRFTSAELPGLFSGHICSSSSKETIQPWCSCKQQLSIVDTVDSWCNSYAEFSKCIENSLQGQSASSQTSYLSHVFNKTLMDTRMKYLCQDGDFPTVVQCEKETESCHNNFTSNLAADLTKDRACVITESLSTCLWTNQRCPAKLRHMLSRLADSFTTGSCIKFYKETAGERCRTRRVKIFPDKDNFEECLDGVLFQLDCMNRESFHSDHSQDQFYNIDADRLNIYIYEAFRCEQYKKHRQTSCFKRRHPPSVSECYDGFQQKEKNFVTAIKMGQTLPLDSICRFFENATECFANSIPDCQPKADNFVALVCSAFPKSCSCPMKLDKNYADTLFRKNNSPCFSKNPFTLSVLVVVLCLLQQIISKDIPP